MITIITNNIRLDLFADLNISITIENPMLTQDRTPTPYSLNMDFPNTAKNCKVFGIVEALPLSGKDIELHTIIRCDGLPFMEGVLTFDNYSDSKITAAFIGALIPDSSKKEVHSMEWESWKFPRARVGNTFPREYSACTAEYEYFLKNLIADTTAQIVYAPVRNITKNKTIASYDFGKQSVSHKYYASFYNSRDNSIIIDRPSGGTWPYSTMMGLNYPMVRISSVINIMFDGKLKNNPFNTGDLSKLVIVTTHKESANAVMLRGTCGMNTIIHEDKSITFDLSVSDGLPLINTSELFNNLLKLICGTVIPFGRTFVFQYNRDILKNQPVVDWSDKIATGITISIESGQKYKYGYANLIKLEEDSPEQYHECISAREMLQSQDAAYYSLTNHGDKYRKEFVDGNYIFTQLTQSGMTSPPIDDDCYDSLVNNITPIRLNYNNALTDDLSGDAVWWMVPELEFSTPEEAASGKRPSIIYIGIYHGVVALKPIRSSGNNLHYPFVSDKGVDTDGNYISDLSLQWNGARGLYENYHKEFAEWIAKKRIVIRANFNLSYYDIRNLDVSQKIILNSRSFLIKELSVSITNEGILPADVQLIEV